MSTMLSELYPRGKRLHLKRSRDCLSSCSRQTSKENIRLETLKFVGCCLIQSGTGDYWDGSIRQLANLETLQMRFCYQKIIVNPFGYGEALSGAALVPELADLPLVRQICRTRGRSASSGTNAAPERASP